MNSIIRGISRVFNFITEWPGFFAVLAMAATVSYGVIVRYVFRSPEQFVIEYNGYLNVIVVLIPLSYVLRKGGHIRIDLITNLLPKKFRNSIEVGTLLLSLVVVIILTIGTIQLAVASFKSGTRAFTPLETPIGPLQAILPVGLFLFAIQIIVEIVRKITPHGADGP